MSKPSKVFGSWLDRPAFTNSDTTKDHSGELAASEETRKQGLRDRINAMYGIGDQNAAKQMTDEQAQVGDATRGYYTDQLARSFGAAERNTRFNLARQGLMGGQADIDANKELQTDKDLGATRIDEAARRAVLALQAQREQERLNANNLVNAGAGDEAVRSAQSGLASSLSNAQTAQRANLFNDLFTTGADAFASQNYNQALAAQLARFQGSLGAYYPTKSSGGAVTPS